jgi:hypothetical protein
VPDHPSLAELADAAEGLLETDRAAEVAAHRADCAECQAHTEALAEVTARLAAVPAPPMPPEVADRLNRILAGERMPSRLRAVDTDNEDTLPVRRQPPPRATLGTFGADRPRRPARRWLVPALAAAAAALVIGFGGYVLSATAGLNEPPVVAALSSTEDLGAQAGAVAQRVDLTPHRFSRAWRCARDVTDGRITGIASTTVDGVPALLVYLAEDGGTQVVVVTGCGGEAPSAAASAPVTR